MTDREKVMSWLEGLTDEDWPSFYSDHEVINTAKAALTLLKEQEELIKALKRDLDLVRSCKVCRNWTECTPDAPPESPEFKMWRDCGGSCKLNWKWRGI